jgi:predicted house-cleaning noncanonical NTP pyrophosphatase (MazG superfamily)
MSEEKTYNKLVRDNIPDVIAKDGFSSEFHIAKSDEEYKNALRAKIEEELNELFDDRHEKEMSDVQEVLLAIAEFFGIDLFVAEELRKKKAKDKGIFSKRIILEKTKKED